MAKFKVGQRVRVVDVLSNWPEDHARLVGREGVIVRVGVDWEWIVHLPGVPHIRRRGGPRLESENYGFDSGHLAPLEDPKVEQFIESIKRLKPYEEPKVPERHVALVQGKSPT